MFTEHMAVTSDGKYILMGKDGGNWIVDEASGERRILKTASGEEFRGVLTYMVMQPNGSRVAFNGGASVAEIWVMEGFWCGISRGCPAAGPRPSECGGFRGMKVDQKETGPGIHSPAPSCRVGPLRFQTTQV